MKTYLITYSDKQKFIEAFKALKPMTSNEVSTYTSYDVEEIDQMMSIPVQKHAYSFVAFTAAMCGMGVGFFMQYYAEVQSMALNIGGRPLNSWPAFIPVTFILLVLFSAVATYIYLFVDLHLPQPSHPIFFAQSFGLAKNQFQIHLRTDQIVDLAPLMADQVEELP